MSLFSIDFSLLFLTFFDRFSIAPGASLITALEIFRKVLFFPTFLAKFKTFLNALLKPLAPCLTHRLRPLGAAHCLYGRSIHTFPVNSASVKHVCILHKMFYHLVKLLVLDLLFLPLLFYLFVSFYRNNFETNSIAVGARAAAIGARKPPLCFLIPSPSISLFLLFTYGRETFIFPPLILLILYALRFLLLVFFIV